MKEKKSVTLLCSSMINLESLVETDVREADEAN